MAKLASIDLTLQIVNISRLTNSLDGVVESWGIYANGKYIARVRRNKDDGMWEIWPRRAEKPSCRKRDPRAAILDILKGALYETIGNDSQEPQKEDEVKPDNKPTTRTAKPKPKRRRKS